MVEKQGSCKADSPFEHKFGTEYAGALFKCRNYVDLYWDSLLLSAGFYLGFSHQLTVVKYFVHNG